MKARNRKKKEDNLSAESSVSIEKDDMDLIRKAREGDMGAFEELIQKYDRHVLSLAFSYARNSDDAKDIYQETIIRAYKSMKKFEMRSEFSTWLYRIATNVCITFKSRQRRYSEMFTTTRQTERRTSDDHFPVDHPSPESTEGEFLRAELGRQIERALGKLSPMQRLVFTMKHYEGYRLREIASITNSAEGTVKRHLYDAVRRLQRELVEVMG